MIVGFRRASRGRVGQGQRYLRGPDKNTAGGHGAWGWWNSVISAAHILAKLAVRAKRLSDPPEFAPSEAFHSTAAPPLMGFGARQRSGLRQQRSSKIRVVFAEENDGKIKGRGTSFASP